MANTVKNEHYVPRCYLEAWTRAESNQIYVYDKIRRSFRATNIDNVACQRYFYDTDPLEVLPREKLLELLREKKTINPDRDHQFLEHAYAQEVEGLFKEHLKKLIATAHNATPWIIEHCYFCNSEEKAEFSELLTIQYLRTKSIRNSIEDSANNLVEALKDMGFPEYAIEKWKPTKKRIKNSHLRMLLDIDSMEKTAPSFYFLTWILVVNRTSSKFFTSDSPIIPIPHLSNPMFPGTGLRSKGVEVFFPISPEYAMVMVDGEYHNIQKSDRRIVVSNDPHLVKKYNLLTVQNASENVFSLDGEWSPIKEIIHIT